MRKFLFYLTSFLLLFIAFALIYNPERYIKSCFEGLTVWAITVLPSLLPFFFISLLFTNLGIAGKFCKKLEKPVCYLYKTSPISSFVQFMSFISGYPVGAKLISELYKEGIINEEESTKISLFTSTSGPMFIVGSVGVGMFKNKTAGIILLCAHYLSAILNGLIFRRLGLKKRRTYQINCTLKQTDNILYDCAYGATLSCLVVGAFISLFYVFCQIIDDFNLLYPLTLFFSFLFCDKEKARAFCAGLIECTNGCILFSTTQGFLTLPLSAFIISFGGLSILFQSISYLQQAKVNIKLFLLSKVLQAITAFLITALLTLVIF